MEDILGENEDKENYPVKGDSAPLEISNTEQRRVHIGIGWDVREEEERKRKLFGKTTEDGDNQYVQINVEQYDMDLVALIFDADGNAVDAVSPELDEVMDQSGKIYHSGDNDTGRGDYDDEVISVELGGIPDYIHHIVFLITAQSGHTFDRILESEARIADGKTDKNALKIKMGKDGKDKTACIFARIYKRGDRWMVHNISEYRMDADVEDWVEEIKPYLS